MVNINFTLYKNSDIAKNLSKDLMIDLNNFNLFLFLYFSWNYNGLVKGKLGWFFLASLFNSKDYKFQINTINDSHLLNHSGLKIFPIDSLNFVKNNFFKNFSFLKFERFISYNFAFFPIKFKPSNILFFLSQSTLKKLNINFIRKSKVFNKGRYSRNRQYYRTGFYWCLYVNIVAVVGLYFWFYRFLINFSYLWWLLFAFILSFIFSKFFNIYKLGFLKSYLKEEFIWIEQIVSSLFFDLNFSKLDILFCDILLTKIIGGRLFFFYLNN